MDELIFNSLSQYFAVLKKTGYYKYPDVLKLLVLIFYRDFVFNDYNPTLSKADYMLIERALNCLYGTSCLTPYPDYLKMGKLHIGEITELSQRIKNMEDTKVVKVKQHVKTVPDINIPELEDEPLPGNINTEIPLNPRTNG